ncbi:MAG: hypothetical protein ABI743_11840 [bacterium]
MLSVPRRLGHFRIACLLLLVVISGIAWGQTAAGHAPVVLLDLRGPLTPGLATYLEDGIAQASLDGAQLIVLTLDSPGGQERPTRHMLQALMSSTIPVMIVIPPGGRVSATAPWLLLGADRIVLGPGARVGPAIPIALADGPAVADLQLPALLKSSGAVAAQSPPPQLTTNTFIEELAREREWPALGEAVLATLKGERLSGHSAFINSSSGDLQTMLEALDGKALEHARTPTVLYTANPALIAYAPVWYLQLWQLFADPTVVLLCLLLGIWGLLSELLHPGTIAPGIVGGIALMGAIAGINALPINLLGITWIVLGTLGILGEAKVAGPGYLGIPGAVLFVIGAVTLIPTGYVDLGIPAVALVLIGYAVLVG